jgi:hypothetical protein
VPRRAIWPSFEYEMSIHFHGLCFAMCVLGERGERDSHLYHRDVTHYMALLVPCGHYLENGVVSR